MKSILSVVFALFVLSVFSQNGDNLWKEDRGRVIIKQNNEVKGNDFLYEEWNNGMLVLNDSVFSRQDYLKYDAFNSRVLIKNMKDVNEIIEISDNSLTGFSILESNKKHDFVKLYNKNFISDEDDGFYEVVFNLQNTNYFLKRTTKIIYDRNKSKGSQTINNFPLEYRDLNNYFIKNDEGLYVNVKLKKKEINAVLAKNSKLRDAFVKGNKIKYNNEDDVLKLVNYYYSIQ